MQDEGLELDRVDEGALDDETFEDDSHDDEALVDSDAVAQSEPDEDSVREMYRYSLGRATQDASPGRLERWVRGASHGDDSAGGG